MANPLSPSTNPKVMAENVFFTIISAMLQPLM